MSKVSEIICLVVDDEPLARENITEYILEVPGLKLHAGCSNAIEAIEVIKNEQIDLVFLDINMPKLSGIEMIKTLDHPPLVIFTTAYSEHALEGFELDAVDYLLKPIRFERFIKAVNKAKDKLNQNNNTGDEYLLLKSDKKTYKVELDQIYYFEACGDYIKAVTKDQRILTHKTMKSLEDELNPKQFLRVHKSYIVSLKHIRLIEGNMIKVNEESIPIGSSYKEKLLQSL